MQHELNEYSMFCVSVFLSTKRGSQHSCFLKSRWKLNEPINAGTPPWPGLHADHSAAVQRPFLCPNGSDSRSESRSALCAFGQHCRGRSPQPVSGQCQPKVDLQLLISIHSRMVVCDVCLWEGCFEFQTSLERVSVQMPSQ